jgi:phage pi2 protein 07
MLEGHFKLGLEKYDMKVWTGFILLRRDDVSELRSPTDLLFIPQVIYEHGKPRWDAIDGGKVIRPSELTGRASSSHLVAKEMLNFANEVYPSYL